MNMLNMHKMRRDRQARLKAIGMRLCSKCNTIKNIEKFGNKGNKHPSSSCYRCKNARPRVRANRKRYKVPKNQMSIKALRGTMIRHVRRSAKKRNMDCNLTTDTVEWPTHCPYLGVELDYLGSDNGCAHNTASFDRIDPTRGYVIGNVEIISRRANVIKNDLHPKEWRLLMKMAERLKKLNVAS